MFYTLQPSEFTDQVLDDGTELTKLPYPFHVVQDGSVQRQDFWRGNPTRVIGFQRDLAVHRVDVWWSQVLKAPETAVGLYLVTEDSEGRWAVWENAIADVEVHADLTPPE